MDYHSIHGQDVTNLSSPLKHRMPTVSAAQALQSLQSSTPRAISTGIASLDAALQDPVQSGIHSITAKGVSRGHVTEVYGPPSVGKTSFGMQLTVNALKSGEKVVWIDAANPLPAPRLARMLDFLNKVDENSSDELLNHLTHYQTPTLPHLAALICQSGSVFPPSNTSLVVIDSLSSLIAGAFARVTDNAATPAKTIAPPKHDPQQWATSRKWTVLQFLVSALQKLAALQNIAVVILGQVSTKMQGGSRAIVVPAISSLGWDGGISTRIVLFRDWGRNEKQVRFAEILKNQNTSLKEQYGRRVFAFTITEDGLQESHILKDSLVSPPSLFMKPPRKRKAEEIEIGDSEEDEDEDYGWNEEDAGDLPVPPSQWQGSEDIMVRGPEDIDEEEDDENDRISDDLNVYDREISSTYE